MRFYQQGDVLIQSSQIPAGAQQAPAGRILAHGEVTGHAHRLTEASDGLLVEIDGQLYLRVGEGGATITHEEHKPVEVPQGDYRIGRVQEYDHFAEEARIVRD